MPRSYERAKVDPLRPKYHFIAPSGWMNDPNGLILFRGEYHVFYQHNPNGAFAGTRHWGHAVSKDLIRWRHLPTALSPGNGGYDKDGCWSGSAVDNDGVPVILYTGVMPEVQCVALGSQDMVYWEKYAGNPVISSHPEGLDLKGFRDPCVWKEDGRWYMLLGSGIEGKGGTALLYESNDLLRWRYLHPICFGRIDRTGEVWECPDFFPLEDKHVLIISALKKTLYYTGKYRDKKFHPEMLGTVDLGDHFYAAKSMIDEKGRRILFGWVREARSGPVQLASGWSGLFSLPRQLALDKEGILNVTPLPELKSLRGDSFEDEGVKIDADSCKVLEDVEGDCLEIEADLDLGDARELGLIVRCSPRLEEATFISYNRRSARLYLDSSKSSLNPECEGGREGGALKVDSGEHIKLSLFLDRSAIEVFANGRICLTGRAYPSRGDSKRIGIFSRGGSAKLASIKIWKMKPIWD